MADTLTGPSREGFLAGEIDWNTAVIKVSLVRGYTYASTHKFMSDVTVTGTIVATQTLATVTVTDGTADAADVTFPSVPTGAAIGSLVIYQASAVTGGADVAATAQRVIAHIDAAAGLPVTPNGGNISVAWANVEPRIFRL